MGKKTLSLCKIHIFMLTEFNNGDYITKKKEQTFISNTITIII